MKALFFVDNIPVVDMFMLVTRKLPSGWVSVFVDYNGTTKQSKNKLGEHIYETGIKHRLLGGYSKQAVAEVIVREKPNVMVLAREETNIVEHSIVELGKTMNIPTLLVPHGILYPMGVNVWETVGFLFRLEHLRILLGQGYRKLIKGNMPIGRLAKTGMFRISNDYKGGLFLSRYSGFTRVAAYGEVMGGVLLDYHVQPGNIVITGNPKFDVYCVSVDTHNNTLLLLTDYFVEFGLWNAKQRRNFVLDVLWVANKLSQNLKIKVHPVMESILDYEKIVRGEGVSVYQHEPLVELIGECDIGITATSSAGLEVMASGKSLVIYNPYRNVTPYRLSHGVSVASTKEELLEVIDGIIKNGISEGQKKLARNFVEKQVYGLYITKGFPDAITSKPADDIAVTPISHSLINSPRDSC